MSYADLSASILGGPARLRQPAPYGLIRVAGPASREFLHRMCSQDIAGMADGEVRSAAFLDGKGRLLALCQAALTGDTVWLSTQEDTCANLAELLERFHFTEDLTISQLPLLCGEILEVGPPAGSRCRPVDGAELCFDSGREGLRFTRFHAPAQFFAGSWHPAGLAPLDPAEAEALRIATGEPWVGRDSEPTTLALELPIADHISTTKGCYTGQEIVARIHTYGHTNRSLRRLAITGTGPVPPGTLLVEPDEGDPVGRVMSAADLPGEDRRIAFGFVPGALAESGTELALGEPGGALATVL